MLQNATSLWKSAPRPPNISDEHDFCTAPATRHASLKILFKCPTPAIAFGNATEPSRFSHLKVHNPLRLPGESTSERPKVLRTRRFFALLTSKCACHNGVHFFDISTSKGGPELVCFVHFDFKICFAPQRRALFRHLNFQKWSGAGVFCTFWLRNALRATTACTFSTSQLPKVVRTWCILYILTCRCASRHNGVQFFISHLARWLRTRRSHKSLEKHTVSRLSYLFAHLHLFFFWLFLLSDLLSSTLLFSLPLPISAFHPSILSEVWLLNFLR